MMISRRLFFGGVPTTGFFTVLFVGLGLSACGGKIPLTSYYVLEFPQAPQMQLETGHASVVVMPFRASAMLAQDRIVYRPAPGKVGFYEYHRWAEEPSQTITTAFISRLRALKTFEMVVPFDGRTRVDYILKGRIEKLEEVDFGSGVKVEVRVAAEMVSSDDRKVIWRGTTEQTGQVTLGEVSAVVIAMSQAALAGLDELLTNLDKWFKANVVLPGPG